MCEDTWQSEKMKWMMLQSLGDHRSAWSISYVCRFFFPVLFTFFSSSILNLYSINEEQQYDHVQTKYFSFSLSLRGEQTMMIEVVFLILFPFSISFTYSILYMSEKKGEEKIHRFLSHPRTTVQCLAICILVYLIN